MKTLLSLFMIFNFTFSSSSHAQSESDLTKKIESFLDEAGEMKGDRLPFKKLIVLNALSSLAASNIREPKLIKRVTDDVLELEQMFTKSQMALIEKDLKKLEQK